LNFKFLLYSILPAVIVSCSVGPPYIPPSIETPSEWKNKQETTCEGYEKDENGEFIYLDHWWQVFHDQKLEELENWAIENNRQLLIAYERIQEARALMGIAAANFYPLITLNPFTTNTVELTKNYTNLANTTTPLTNGGNPRNCVTNNTTSSAVGMPFRAHEVLYSLPVNMSYQVDLWGKIRDQYQAARYNWLAQKKDYDVVMLTLTANLAIAYYQLRAADAQIDLLLKTLKTRQKALEINTARYEEQITFYADVTLAAEEVEIVQNQYFEVLRQRDVLEDLIAILIGVPASEFSIEHLSLKGTPPCIPEGMPSEILLRRPDIAEAEYNMRSQHASVKQAYSQFFPSLILTASVGFQSPTLKP
jgi:multidrug efflux system outer membrane protein